MDEPMTTDLRAVAHVVSVIRPDWDTHGIHAALTRATDAGYPFGDIAHAAIDAARTPSTQTPAGIGERLRGGWRTDAGYDKPTPTPPPVDELWKQRPRPEECRPGPSPEQKALIQQALLPDPRTTTEVPF